MASGKEFVCIQLRGGEFGCISGEGSFARVLIADIWNLNVNAHKAFLPIASIVAFELSTYVRVKVPLGRLVAMRTDRIADHLSRWGGLVEGDFVAFVEPIREPGSWDGHDSFREVQVQIMKSLDRGKES